jgi:hypothetical protein
MREDAIPRWFSAGLVLVALAAIAATVAAPGAFRALPLLAPDSTSYLEWSPGRTPAYPVFLALIRALSPDLGALGAAQLAIFLAAAVFCATAHHRLYGHPVIALLVASAIMLHPQLVSYAFTALPELLFSATLLVHVGCVFLALLSMRTRWYVMTGVTLAVLILLKPSGYALVACMPALALSARARPWRAMLATAVPLGAALIAVSAVNLARHGFFATQAQGGYSLVAHVGAFVDAADPVTTAIAADARPQRDAFRGAMTIDVYYLLTSHEYHALERIVRRRIVEDVERRQGAPIADQRQFPSDARVLSEITRAGTAIARRAILDHPRDYARHVAAQLYGLWFLPLIQPPDGVARLNAALQQIGSAVPGLAGGAVAFRSVPLPIFLAVRALLALSLIAATVAIVLMVIRRTPATVATGYAGLALHANYVLVAAVQPGLPRYALVMWPACVIVLAGCASLLIERLRGDGMEPRQARL